MGAGDPNVRSGYSHIAPIGHVDAAEHSMRLPVQDPPVLSTGNPGMIRYDAVQRLLRVWTGTDWLVIAGSTIQDILVNVKAHPYNAEGDGVTDDSAGIQAALTYAAGTGKTVYFPEGTYYCADATLLVTGDLTIAGAGMHQSAILRGAVQTSPGVSCSIYNITFDGGGRDGLVGNTQVYFGTDNHDFTLSGMRITNLTATAGNPVYGLRVFAAQNVRIERCMFDALDSTVGTGVTRGIQFATGGAATIRTANVVVSNCLFEDIAPTVDGDGIAAQGDADQVDGILIDGCTFKNVAKSAVKIQCYNVTVRDCRIFGGCNYAGIRAPIPGGFVGEGIVISGNVLWDLDCLIPINLSKDYIGLIVTDNDVTVVDGVSYPIRIGAGGQTVEAAVVANNVLRAVPGGTCNSGISIRGTVDAVIANNVIQDVAGYGVQAVFDFTAGRLVVVGNAITGVGAIIDPVRISAGDYHVIAANSYVGSAGVRSARVAGVNSAAGANAIPNDDWVDLSTLDSPYAVKQRDKEVTCDTTAGAIVLTLPPATAVRGMLTSIRQDAGANTVTVNVTGADTIDDAGDVGNTSATFNAAGEVLVLLAGNSQWIVLNNIGGVVLA